MLSPSVRRKLLFVKPNFVGDLVVHFDEHDSVPLFETIDRHSEHSIVNSALRRLAVS
ncbi:hypothetical protein [Halegenticoccus soli]|uniref:hypothetical protein n=1 Tax=Halegenticoccus soli TaxID=1985678 RepID=UPI0013042673|nr:hypothetical protein [Halegenticoccus soli]